MTIVFLVGAMVFVIGVGKSVASQTVPDALSSLRYVIAGLLIILFAVAFHTLPAS